MFPKSLRLLVVLVIASAWPFATAAQGPSDRAAIRYDVEMTGVGGELASRLEAHSLLLRNRETPPLFYGALRALIDEDVRGLERVLRSEGHYAARIEERIDASTDPLRIILEIDPGPRFPVADVQIIFRDQPPSEEVHRDIERELPLKAGDPVRAKDIIAAEDWIAGRLRRSGYPLAETLEREVVIDHRTQQGHVRFRFSPGPKILFGPLQFEGADSVDRAYLQRLVPWQEGAPYDQRLVDAYRSALMGTRLFSGVTIAFVEPAATLAHATGPVTAALRASLSEARLRTIAVSAGFSTSEGVGGEVSWEHRNFFGAGERLALTLKGAEIEQSLVADFRKPEFRRLGQTLTAGVGIVHEDSDAFESLEFRTRLGLERRLGRRWTLTAQGEAAFSNVDDLQGSRNFFLAALPLGIAWDSRDDLLDPTQGVSVRSGIAPHLAFQDSLFGFLKSDIAASAYQHFLGRDVVFAERLHMGSITGASRDRLPATRRFFAGGGGSIRGFGFQNVGPLDADGDPLGGRSLFEMSLEMRTRIGQRFGVVPFVDAGQVWEQTLPRFDGLRWAAGLGLRYFTSFAPIRFDVAFPINRRPGDDRVQFYISLGQSF